jgi:hypothetical protein
MFHSISCFLCVCVEVVDGRTSSEFEVTSHMYRQIGMRSNNSEHLEVHPSSLCWAPSVFAFVFFRRARVAFRRRFYGLCTNNGVIVVVFL